MKSEVSLEKKLRQYSIMAMPASPINAQIIYTDVVPDTTVGFDADHYALDLNNDGISDFMFKSLWSSGSKWALAKPFPYTSQNQNAIGASLSGSAFPYALGSGQIIDGNLNWVSLGNLAYNNFPSATFPWASWEILGWYYQDASSSTWSGGNWNGMSGKFIPLRLSVNGNIHYGWARLDVAGSSYPFTIKDYAYNSIPGQLIHAGDTLGNISTSTQEELSERHFVVYTNPGNAELIIESPFMEAELSIFNSLGQKVFGKHIISSKEFVSLSDLSSGIYIIRLQHADNILKEKIIIE